jgi:hypothetical protein
MPARDFYHDTVKNVLIKDGWTITHDPFPLRYGIRRLYADLGAETHVQGVMAVYREFPCNNSSFKGIET